MAFPALTVSHCPLLDWSRALGMHPGQGLGRDKRGSKGVRWCVWRRNQDPGWGLDKTADTVHGVRAKFQSQRELTPQIARRKFEWVKIKQIGDQEVLVVGSKGERKLGGWTNLGLCSSGLEDVSSAASSCFSLDQCSLAPIFIYFSLLPCPPMNKVNIPYPPSTLHEKHWDPCPQGFTVCSARKVWGLNLIDLEEVRKRNTWLPGGPPGGALWEGWLRRDSISRKWLKQRRGAPPPPQKQKDSEDSSECGRWSQLGEEVEHTEGTERTVRRQLGEVEWGQSLQVYFWCQMKDLT